MEMLITSTMPASKKKKKKENSLLGVRKGTWAIRYFWVKKGDRNLPTVYSQQVQNKK